MDDEQRSFLTTFRTFLEKLVYAEQRDGALTPLGERIQQHIGADVQELPSLSEQVAPHRLVDADLALESLRGDDGELIGITHGQNREHEQFPGFLVHPHVAFAPGPVDFESKATGPDSTRRVVTFGIHLLHWKGAPYAVLQRGPRSEYGRTTAVLEIIGEDPDRADALIAEIRRRMIELSVLRGQVLTLTGNEFGNGAGGADFVRRPDVPAEQVVLADGVLDTIARHVVEIGANRERLREAGQHLKRGVLLYGPPGTGKTLTVRHLLSRTSGTTAVLLTGPSIQFITAAAELARAMQPAIVVLEDVDLVAGDRMMHHGPQPLLFAVLDALDGLDGDADVTFLLTTNRVELLESALAERPGRVDLAVEIALPDAAARRRLFRLYARDLPLSDAALDAAADRAEGVTGSFAKELIRRAVLAASLDDREVTDSDVDSALDDLLSDRERLTRTLLGARAETHPPDSEPGAGGGWVAYTPLSSS